MLIRLGYVAIALNLEDSSTSRTITLTNLQKLLSAEQQILRLQRIVKENLANLLRVIRYNTHEKIHVYRLTSKLIPFSTYPLGFEWDYINLFSSELANIGQLIRDSGMRISAHPDHFTVVNSPDERVFRESVQDLGYHNKILQAMGMDDKSKLVLHLGGFYGDKTESINRFIRNFYRLPEKVQARIVLENDDKIYTAKEVLGVCQELQIPMVLDIHHHMCNPSSLLLNELLPQIWDTWHGEIPKIHVSSPKDQKRSWHHSDYVEASSLAEFINIAAPLQRDFDVMVEAKMKDKAMFKLVEDIAKYPGVERVGPAEVEFSDTKPDR